MVIGWDGTYVSHFIWKTNVLLLIFLCAKRNTKENPKIPRMQVSHAYRSQTGRGRRLGVVCGPAATYIPYPGATPVSDPVARPPSPGRDDATAPHPVPALRKMNVLQTAPRFQPSLIFIRRMLSHVHTFDAGPNLMEWLRDLYITFNDFYIVWISLKFRNLDFNEIRWLFTTSWCLGRFEYMDVLILSICHANVSSQGESIEITM